MDKLFGVSTALAAQDSSDWLQQANPPADRVDLLIDPKSKRWAAVHNYFTTVLKKDIPVKSIIRKSFTHHQYRMLAPAERADVKELQATNTKRYNALLSGRFKGVENSLATKLTMMYFGLPAAPIDNVLEEIAMARGLEAEEVPRYNVRPPLHFLTAHDHRNWGKDILKAKEAVNHPLPLLKGMEPTMGLRGGETDDVDTDDDADADDDADTQCLDYIPEDETPALFTDGWTYLYGHYGRLPFVPGKWRSFSKVLRQLLYIVDGSVNEFSLVWFDLQGRKKRDFHDHLPLTEDSPVMAFLQKHFDNGAKSHKNCCVLFVEPGHTEVNSGPPQWEPIKGQLQTDVVRIGRSLGRAQNGPEEEAISYTYIAFPKTGTATFNIGKYGCEQYNAHFWAATNILFGIPKNSTYHHALFRLYDKKKPEAHWTVPIIYGAMGLPQWVWELLNPLNNPDASWMIECCWLDPGVEATIMPNYYPQPNPHLISQDTHRGVARFDEVYQKICEMTTEAFDASVSRKVDSVFLIETEEDETAESYSINGFQMKPRRGFSEIDESGASLGKKLQQSPCLYRILHVNWRPGHCRLFPDWYGGGDISVEMPRLTSSLAKFFDAIEELYQLAAPPPSQYQDPEMSYFLLKEIPSIDSIQVQDMDAPSHFIGADSTENDWYTIRQSITSPMVTVSIVEKQKKVNWPDCISRSNIWGVRLSSEGISGSELPGGVFKREALILSDLDGRIINLLSGYPADPAPLQPIRRRDNLSKVTKKGEISVPRSRNRQGAFERPKLLQVKIQSVGSSGGLSFPFTQVIEGATTPDGDQEYDIGVLVTSQPHFTEALVSGDEPESNSDIIMTPAEEDEPMHDHESESESEDEPENESHFPSTVPWHIDGNGDFLPIFRPDPEYDPDETVGPPANPATITPLEVNRADGPDTRAHTWATQPSIFTIEDQRTWPSDNEIGLPLTAPPAETIHRFTSNVPMFSKGVLTPTEQRELQNSHWNMRGSLLKRTQICPFKNCNFTWRFDDQDALNTHVLAAHTKHKCPFCEDSVFRWTTEQQKIKHIANKHPDKVKQMLDSQMHVGNNSARATTSVPPQRAFPPPQQTGSGATAGPSTSRPPVNPFAPTSTQAPVANPFVKGNVPNPFTTRSGARPPPTASTVPAATALFSPLAAASTAAAAATVASQTVARQPATNVQGAVTQSAPPQPGTLQNSSAQKSSFQAATSTGASSKASQELVIAKRALKKCAFFEKCGAYVGDMTHAQYRSHIQKNHSKEVAIFSSDEEDDDNNDDGGNDDGNDGNDGGKKSGGRDQKAVRQNSPLKPAPKPTARSARKPTPGPAPKSVQQSVHGSAQEVTPSSSPTLDSSVEDEMDMSSDTNVVAPTPGAFTDSAVLLSKKSKTTKKRARKAPAPSNDSDDDDEGDASSSTSAARAATISPPPQPAAAIAIATPDTNPSTSNDDDTDAEAGGSGSKSTTTVGRGRTAKKAKKRRTGRDNDGEYQDGGNESGGDDEEDADEPKTRRRAKSPDWIKKLGPEDPDFEPEDNMYCSKCLRKAPKKRNKSPNRSPIGRASEVEAHSDKTKCCRIRNGIGSAKRLPNRSGWIPASKLLGKLGDLKEKFLRRYPTYMRTMYPLHKNDHNASVWRSDPNNPENSDWWGIPWPPYEGLPPFPGSWKAPDLPLDDGPDGRKRSTIYIGNRVIDLTYRYSTDSDSDDSIEPDVDDIPAFQSDASGGVKRPAADGDDSSGPAPKKAKKSKTAAKKTPKPKGTKKSGGAQPSKKSGKARQQTATASASTSAAPSAPASNAGDD